MPMTPQRALEVVRAKYPELAARLAKHIHETEPRTAEAPPVQNSAALIRGLRRDVLDFLDVAPTDDPTGQVVDVLSTLIRQLDERGYHRKQASLAELLMHQLGVRKLAPELVKPEVSDDGPAPKPPPHTRTPRRTDSSESE